MPNHVTSIVVVRDDREVEDYEEQWADFKAFAAKFKTQESDFDFNAMVPMPPDSDNFMASGAIGQEQERKFGDNTWLNWGTKERIL